MSESERNITTSTIMGGATAANVTVRDFIDDDDDGDTVMLAISDPAQGINLSLFGTLDDLFGLAMAATNKLSDLEAARAARAEPDEDADVEPDEILYPEWTERDLETGQVPEPVTPREPGNS